MGFVFYDGFIIDVDGFNSSSVSIDGGFDGVRR